MVTPNPEDHSQKPPEQMELSSVAAFTGAQLGSGRDHVVYELIPGNPLGDNLVLRALKPEHIGDTARSRNSLEQTNFGLHEIKKIVLAVNNDLQHMRLEPHYTFKIPETLTAVYDNGIYYGSVQEKKPIGNSSVGQNLDTTESNIRNEIIEPTPEHGNILFEGYLSTVDLGMPQEKLKKEFEAKIEELRDELVLVGDRLKEIEHSFDSFDEGRRADLERVSELAELTMDLDELEQKKYDRLTNEDELSPENYRELAVLEAKIQTPQFPEERKTYDELMGHYNEYNFISRYFSLQRNLLEDTIVRLQGYVDQNEMNFADINTQFLPESAVQVEAMHVVGLLKYIELRYGLAIDYFIGNNVSINEDTSPSQIVLVDVEKISEISPVEERLSELWKPFLFSSIEEK